MVSFAYHEPRTVRDASTMLVDGGPGAVALAGGTDVMVEINHHKREPSAVVYLGRIAPLHYLTYSDADGLRVGALARIRELETSPVVQEKYPSLATGTHQFGSVQVRHLATLAGNICRASPSADTAPALIVLEAEVTLSGPKGDRVVPVAQVYQGPGRTCLDPGEILTEVRIPPPGPRSGDRYIKHAIRQALDLAIVGVAVRLDLDDGRCRDCRISLGAVAPTPILATRAQQALIGQPVTPDTIAQAAKIAAEEARPISDVRSSAEYRRKMVEVLTRRALTGVAQDLGVLS